ncbi:hypothetical protein QWZ13_09575 [Reinekea marina]|uniref:Lipoprotein n=1 Tax=Reinekea marina TaxID=1310421 RepID=A0ABV7WXD9_9GAMM|nr:hypothetical protein [Reinekea marina]MDN3649159.1 hypothetical protein [Reinekea marina]
MLSYTRFTIAIIVAIFNGCSYGAAAPLNIEGIKVVGPNIIIFKSTVEEIFGVKSQANELNCVSTKSGILGFVKVFPEMERNVIKSIEFRNDLEKAYCTRTINFEGAGIHDLLGKKYSNAIEKVLTELAPSELSFRKRSYFNESNQVVHKFTYSEYISPSTKVKKYNIEYSKIIEGFVGIDLPFNDVISVELTLLSNNEIDSVLIIRGFSW